MATRRSSDPVKNCQNNSSTHRRANSTSSASSRSISNTLYGICESDCEWNSPHFQCKYLKNQLIRAEIKKELAFELLQMSISNYKEKPNEETERFLREEERQWQLQCSHYDNTQFQLISIKHMIRFGSF